MKGNEGPNLTGRRGNCAESTEIELLCGNVPAQRRPSMPRNRFAMPRRCRCALPPGSEHKSCVLAEKIEGEKALSRPFLASGLYLLHCVVKSSWQAVDSWRWGKRERVGEMLSPPYCYVPINPSFSKSLPIPLSVIPKAELSVTVLENPSVLSGNGSHVSALI